MKTRKILALLLISLLVFTVTPMLAFAAGEVTSVTVDGKPSGTNVKLFGDGKEHVIEVVL